MLLPDSQQEIELASSSLNELLWKRAATTTLHICSSTNLRFVEADVVSLSTVLIWWLSKRVNFDSRNYSLHGCLEFGVAASYSVMHPRVLLVMSLEVHTMRT
eukprot:156346-Amphidinium_carterae.2